MEFSPKLKNQGFYHKHFAEKYKKDQPIMHDNLFKQANPLINESSDETLTNIQAMLGRIQLLRLDLKKMKSNDEPEPSQSFCPASELHIRLLTLVKDAIDHEIKKLHTTSTGH